MTQVQGNITVQRRTTLFAAAALAAGALATTSTTALAQGVRVIHASPDAGLVDVIVGSGMSTLTTLQNIPFRNTDAIYNNLGAGSFNFTVTLAGDPGTVAFRIPDAGDIALTGTEFISAVAIGSLADLVGAGPEPIRPLVLVDDNTSVAGSARVRFIHASPDTPTVDIRLAGGGAVLFAGTSFGEVGDGNPGDMTDPYLTVPNGVYELEAVVVDPMSALIGAVVPLGSFDLSQSGLVATVLATGLVADLLNEGPVPLEATVYVDVVPAPGAAGMLAIAGIAAARRRRHGI